MAMDKTGTLTEGVPKVVDVVPLAGHKELELLRAMGAVEAHSDHPLALAIVEHVRGRGLAPSMATDVRAMNGRGVTARLNGRKYWLGSHRYLEELGQDTPDIRRQLESMSSAGRTVVVMGTDDHVCGFVTLADAVRPESAAAIAGLRQAGIAHVAMLTGDDRRAAEAVAREVGIDRVLAEVDPAGKADAIARLRAEGAVVAMVGDGINDGPALAMADLGIAVGSGTDVAIEASDITLVRGDLDDVVLALRLARGTFATIRQNLAWAFGYNVAAIPLAAAGLLNPILAGAAMAMSSVSVLTNSLRLRRFGRKGAGA